MLSVENCVVVKLRRQTFIASDLLCDHIFEKNLGMTAWLTGIYEL